MFASGGAGYWLSARAMGVLAAAASPFEPAEDMWVGTTLARAGILLHGDRRYNPECPHGLQPDFITVHYVKDPALMRRIHLLAGSAR